MDLFEIMQKFPTEELTYDYFEKYRWNGKPCCPTCNESNVKGRYKELRYFCPKCRRFFSVTTGTYLHNTRMPLQKWLMAFAIVSDAKKGLSALQLHRHLGVHYETAFKMSHTIRDIMSEEKVGKLDDLTEMDETYIGGKPRKPNVKAEPSVAHLVQLEQGVQTIKQAGLKLKGKGNPAKIDVDTKRGRGSQKLIPVTGIVEREGAVVAEVMQKLTAKNLQAMVEKYVNLDESVLITDTYKGYNKLHKIIEHVKIDHSKMYSYRGINTNTIESFWAIVERGIMGQYHHVSLKYLPKYVAEFVFKFNNRKYDDAFETLVMASMKVAVSRPIMKDPNINTTPSKVSRRKPKSLPF